MTITTQRSSSFDYSDLNDIHYIPVIKWFKNELSLSVDCSHIICVHGNKINNNRSKRIEQKKHKTNVK